MLKSTRTRLLGVVFGSAVGVLALGGAAQAQSEFPLMPVDAATPAAPTQEITDAVAPVTSRVQFDFGAQAGYTAFYPPAEFQPLDEHSVSGNGDFTATVFLRRLVDDTSPLMLQPFLQRVSTLQAFAIGGAYTTQSTRPDELLFERKFAGGRGGLALDAYLRRFFAITASFAAEYATQEDYSVYPPAGYPTNYRTSAVTMSSTLGVGLRVADTRIDVGYGVDASSVDSGPFQVPFWGGAMASLRTVIKQYVDLTVRLSALDRGASGRVEVALYPDNNLSLFASAGCWHVEGDPSASTTTQDSVFGNVGGVMWFSRRVAATLRYAPSWTSGYTPAIDHYFRFGMILRS